MKKEIKKEWFLDRLCGQKLAALLTDGKLTEFYCEAEDRNSCVGNIYKGKVVNLLSGMNAAFIHCGLARNCYLSMDEFYTDCNKYDGDLGEIASQPLNLKVGDEIIVQVTKPPRGNKGAKVTTHLSFVGKSCIYLPNTDFLGISRKITDETERARLLQALDKIRQKTGGGYIARTQAPYATPKQMKAETEYLQNLYKKMLKTAETAEVGALLYEDEDLPARMMRDSFGDEISVIHVGDAELYERIKALVSLRSDIPMRKLVMHNGKLSMFQEYGIMPLVYEATRPNVSLPCGAYIVIDETEAMTVIDVNTGSFTGNKNLEDTVFQVNLEAAKEIARQVRLRNVGGIVVVDFIDMAKEEHKVAITEELRKYLAKDKAKCKVLDMSEFCLTQFTRKRIGAEALSFLLKPCPNCAGNGHIHDDIFVVTRIRDAILDCFAQGWTSAIVDLNESVMEKILQEGTFSIEVKNRWRDKRIYLIPHKTFKEEEFTLKGEVAGILNLPDKARLLY
jgi:ribonuclease G